MARPIMRRLPPLVRPLLRARVRAPGRLGWPAPSAIAQESPSVLLTLLSQTSWNCPTATEDLAPGQSTWSCPAGRELVVRFRAQNLGATPLDELAIGVTLYSRVLIQERVRGLARVRPADRDRRWTRPREGRDRTRRDEGLRGLADARPTASTPTSRACTRSRSTSAAASSSVAALRTPVIFLVREPEIPLGLSWTFVLSHPITFAPDGTFDDPSLELALGPGGPPERRDPRAARARGRSDRPRRSTWRSRRCC